MDGDWAQPWNRVRDLLFGPPVVSRTYVQVVLDASSRMLVPYAGKTRFEMVRDELLSVLEAKGTNHDVLGLVAYGHRFGREAEESCSDTEILTPMGKTSLQALKGALRGLQPKGGRGALAKAVMEGMAQFREGRFPTEKAVLTLIILTSGGDDCTPNSAVRLREARREQYSDISVDLRVEGIGVGSEKVPEIRGLAEAMNGEPHSVGKPDELRALLESLLVKEPFTLN